MRHLPFLLTLVLLSLLPFHAFAWTWFHSYFWIDSWTIVVQAWKEIFVVALAVFAGWRFLREPQRMLTPLNLLAIGALGVITTYALIGPGELTQKIYGARILALPLVAFLAAQAVYANDDVRRVFKIAIFTTTGLVTLFALAQIFILPVDFLANFGYSTVVSTWLPGGNLPMYHIVGGTDLIRAQSTFAGPNQLGAYLVVLLPLILGALLQIMRVHNFSFGNWDLEIIWKLEIGNWKFPALFLLLLTSISALFLTYSRAAWLAAGVEIILLVGVYLHHHHRAHFTRRNITLAIIANIIFAVALFVAIPPEWERAVLRTASTGEHITRTIEAWREVVAHPAGLGLGSTAGVSQRFDTAHIGLTPENTYLGWFLELGWLGGALLTAFFATLAYHFVRRHDPLAVSIIGLGVIALVLHPLEDTPTVLTLAILAGVEFGTEND